MKREDVLKKQNESHDVCTTCQCPICHDNTVEFEDEEKLLGAKCSKCGKLDDDEIEFCGCDV